MLKFTLKASILAMSLATFTNQTLALTKTTEPQTSPIEQSISLDPWTYFQQGFNTLLQLDSAMSQQFFANPMNSNRLKMQENSKQFLISMDVPGVDPHKIKIAVTHGILLVQTRENNNKPRQNEQDHYYFSYRVALPDNADIKKISAILKRGVLQISIEKTSKLAAMTEIPVKEIA